jgi:hypothetical protein
MRFVEASIVIRSSRCELPEHGTPAAVATAEVIATSEEKRLGKKYGNCYAVSQELFKTTQITYYISELRR